MHRAWIAFARHGDPGWPAYEAARRATMRFDRVELLDDPGPQQRRAWIDDPDARLRLAWDRQPPDRGPVRPLRARSLTPADGSSDDCHRRIVARPGVVALLLDDLAPPRLGTLLRAARKQRGLTRRDVASRVGTTPGDAPPLRAR